MEKGKGQFGRRYSVLKIAQCQFWRLKEVTRWNQKNTKEIKLHERLFLGRWTAVQTYWWYTQVCFQLFEG